MQIRTIVVRLYLQLFNAFGNGTRPIPLWTPVFVLVFRGVGAPDNGVVDVSILVWYEYAYHVIQHLSNKYKLTKSKWQLVFYF